MDEFFSRDATELALRFLEGLGGARALTVAILLRSHEFDQIATLELDPAAYADAATLYRAVAATSLLRKCEDLPTTFDRAEQAMVNWRKGEAECYKTNERLARYDKTLRGFNDIEPHVDEFLVRVRKKVLSWIGPAPTPLTIGRFGPGATFSDRGVFTTLADKMSSRPSLTRDAIWYLPEWLGTQWGSFAANSRLDPVFVKGNRFTTVPKDARRDRAIAAEPAINVFFQLGLGAQLRRRLLGVGIDLNHGQERHRQVACAASKEGNMATLDLSNASDTLAWALVKLVLPRRWFEALNDLRSPFTQFKHGWVRLEKFSSMGNGFTFELETLIFLALASEALESCGLPARPGKDVLVYGDDIIVPTAGVRSVVSILRFFGFSLNKEKSFSEGSFRESCGGDFYAGHPVRGHYLKKTPCAPEDWITLANGIRRVEETLSALDSSSSLRRSWLFCLDQLPTHIRRCRGPKALGDIVIHDSDPLKWWSWWEDEIRYIRCYRPVRHRKVPYSLFHPSVVMACATYGSAWNDGGLVPRDSVAGYGVDLVAYS